MFAIPLLKKILWIFSTAMSGHRLDTPNPFLTCVTGLFNDNSQEEREFWAKACSYRQISVIKTWTSKKYPWKRQSSPPAPLHLTQPCVNINMCRASC